MLSERVGFQGLANSFVQRPPYSFPVSLLSARLGLPPPPLPAHNPPTPQTPSICCCSRFCRGQVTVAALDRPLPPTDALITFLVSVLEVAPLSAELLAFIGEQCTLLSRRMCTWLMLKSVCTTCSCQPLPAVVVVAVALMKSVAILKLPRRTGTVWCGLMRRP